MKMDDVPDEIVVKGVKGKRIASYRRYIGKDRIPSGWCLNVTYSFDLQELHDADAAKYYDATSNVHGLTSKARIQDE